MAVIYSWCSAIWASKHMMSIPDVRCKRVILFWDTVANAEFLYQNVSHTMIFKSKSEGAGEETVYVMIFTCRCWQQAWIPQSRESVVRCVTVAQANSILRNFPQSQMADLSSLFKYRTTIVIFKPIKVNHLMKEHSLNFDLSSWSMTRLAERSIMLV